ncbi:hypothetical protein ACTZWT_02390 [Rhodopseudomonas sp. NSM]
MHGSVLLLLRLVLAARPGPMTSLREAVLMSTTIVEMFVGA